MLKLGLSLGKPKRKIDCNSRELQDAQLHKAQLRGANVLHRKSLELSRLARKGPIAKSKDLIGALLSHAARTRRASKEPVTIRLRVYSPNGNRAVQFGYK